VHRVSVLQARVALFARGGEKYIVGPALARPSEAGASPVVRGVKRTHSAYKRYRHIVTIKIVLIYNHHNLIRFHF